MTQSCIRVTLGIPKFGASPVAVRLQLQILILRQLKPHSAATQVQPVIQCLAILKVCEVANLIHDRSNLFCVFEVQTMSQGRLQCPLPGTDTPTPPSACDTCRRDGCPARRISRTVAPHEPSADPESLSRNSHRSSLPISVGLSTPLWLLMRRSIGE